MSADQAWPMWTVSLFCFVTVRACESHIQTYKRMYLMTVHALCQALPCSRPEPYHSLQLHHRSILKQAWQLLQSFGMVHRCGRLRLLRGSSAGDRQGSGVRP